MGSVLCVTQGGQGGVHAQTEAITIAKERGDPLTFLYVADSSFLNKVTLGVIVDVEGMLERMGRFFLSMAIERASTESVKAGSLVRHGVMREVLPNVASEVDATTIIIGQLTGDSVCFDRSEMDEILDSIGE